LPRVLFDWFIRVLYRTSIYFSALDQSLRWKIFPFAPSMTGWSFFVTIQ
jgi:hypothetical protein